MIRSIIVYPFISCFAWSLLSGFLYLFSGENLPFSGFWDITFLSLVPLFLATIINFFIHKKQVLELYVAKLLLETNLFFLFLYLWIFYFFIFMFSFVIQGSCFYYIYDLPIIYSIQCPILTIKAHFFTSLFFFLKKML